MDSARRFTNFFHNFVVMKKSVKFLPPKKLADLEQLVGLVRQHIKEVHMVILYGSYARNSYVDYDQRIEFGVPTYYMSDYDIAILTRKPIGAIDLSLYDKIKDAFFQHKVRNFHTHPEFINYGIEDFNYALRKAHYFETEIKREGIILYDSGEYKLERRRKLNFQEIKERAQGYYDAKFGRALSFLRSERHDVDDNDILMASFHLHQATENLLRVIPLVFILYGHKSHKLSDLMKACKPHTEEIYKVFPRDTDEEERLFKLLERAYVESRYNPDFEITKEDIDALLPKVEHLRRIVERVCTAQIAYYDRQIRK
ncbi:HEPN domain-containing protein [Alistipes sp.]|uniref:HEPN domain-containing protein n=1 Tax=Alistipes sp. TaxID=1872444 RepID=UPI003AF02EC0